MHPALLWPDSPESGAGVAETPARNEAGGNQCAPRRLRWRFCSTPDSPAALEYWNSRGPIVAGLSERPVTIGLVATTVLQGYRPNLSLPPEV